MDYARLRVAAELAEAGRRKAEAIRQGRLAHMVSYEFSPVNSEAVSMEEATKAYKSGRKASQQIHGSASSVLVAINRLESVLAKNKAALPFRQFQSFTQSATRAKTELEHLLETASVGEDFIKNELAVNKKTAPRPISENVQTLLWWYAYVPRYPRKWVDMQSLAYAWCVSKISEGANLRAYVKDELQKRRFVDGCPPWAMPLSPIPKK